MNHDLQTAVILAAGMGTRLKAEGEIRPKGFLQFGAASIIEESLERLTRAGIRRVIIITGHLAHFYHALSAGYEQIQTVHNPHYASTGSMYSLYCAREHLAGEDFLLLESDLIYEQRALTEIQSCLQANVLLMSDETRSGDEVWIEAPAGRLINMSKNPASLKSVAGELVGICKISAPLYQTMCSHAAKMFAQQPTYCYETDCLVAVAAQHPVHCHKAAGLIWSEIDDAAHLQRARQHIYPAILHKDGSQALTLASHSKPSSEI